MRSRRRIVSSALLLSVAGACSEVPPEPTRPDPLMLPAGAYTFTTSLTGATCVATGQPPPDALSVQVAPEQRGSDSVFLPVNEPGSTFEFWIHRTSTNGRAILVNGQILGRVRTSATPLITADFGSGGVVSGSTDLTQGNGLITGQVRFADGSGNALTCTNLRWAFARN